jgi:hypothetical protein
VRIKEFEKRGSLGLGFHHEFLEVEEGFAKSGIGVGRI